MTMLKRVRNSAPLSFILGPCVLESEQATLEAADFLTSLSHELSFDFVFKGSFDKANRSSVRGFRGMGPDKGLAVLESVKSRYGVPVITDVHESAQVPDVASVVDIIQIPAFLARQTDLLKAAGASGKYVHVKKGQFMTARQAGAAVEKIKQLTENENVWLCERGYTFGYENLVVDYRNFEQLKAYNVPVIFDATHSVQLPGASRDGSSGGQRTYVSALAAAAVTQRIAGIFMEVHPEPEKALCDGPNSVRWSDLPQLIRYLQNLDQFVKSQPPVVLDQAHTVVPARGETTHDRLELR